MEPVNQPPETSPGTQTENIQTGLPNPDFETKPVTAGTGKRWTVLAALGLLIAMVSAAGYLGQTIQGPQKKIISPPVSLQPTPESTVEPIIIIEETVFPSPTVSSPPISDSGVKFISLIGQKGEGKMLLSWWSERNFPKGFRVLWSSNPGPTYPLRDGDSTYYLSSPATTQYQISPLAAGKTYYFRVCSYLEETCGEYSNELAVQY